MSGSKSKKTTYDPDDILSDDIDPDNKTKQNMQDIQDMQDMQELDRNNYQYINNNQDNNNNNDDNNDDDNNDDNDNTELEDDYKFVEDFLYSDSELRELLKTGSISDILPVFKLNEESTIEDAYSGIDNTVILANANQKYNTAELLVQLGNQLIANLYQKQNPMNPYLDFDTITNPNSSTLLKNGIVDRSDNTYIDRTNKGSMPVMKEKYRDVSNSYVLKYIQGEKNQVLRNTYIKSILLDSKYRDSTYKYPSEYAIQLSETIKNVVSLKVKSVTIPNFLYNISSTLGNSLALFNPGKTNTTDSDVIIANNAYYEITSKTGIDNLSDSLFSYKSDSFSVIPGITTPYTESVLLPENAEFVKKITTPMWFFLFDESSKKIIINCLVPTETFPILHTSPTINFPSIVWWSLLLENQYNGCNIFNISKYHNLGITLGFQDLKRNKYIDREDEHPEIFNTDSHSNYFVTSENVDTEYKTVLNIQNTHSASGTKPIRIKRNDIHIVLPLKFQVPEGYTLYSQVAMNQSIPTQSKYLMALIDDYQYSRIPTQLITTQSSETIPDRPHQFSFQQNNVPKLSTTCSFPSPPYKSSYKETCNVETDDIIVYNYDTKRYEIFNIKNTVIKSQSNPRLNTQANIYKKNVIKQTASNNDSSQLDQSHNKSNVLVHIPYPPKGSISNPINYITFTSQLSLINREYFGPVNISKLKIQLLNDEGYSIDLANQNWSIVIEAEVLYQF